MAKIKPKITGKTTLGETISFHPQASQILMKYGLHCIGCHIAMQETVEDGARAHGLDKKEIVKMLSELNQLTSTK